MKIYVSFTDHDGHEVSVSASSLATRPAVRVYLKRPEGNATGDPTDARAGAPPEVDECLHLTLPQAQMLRAGLDEWLDDVREEGS